MDLRINDSELIITVINWEILPLKGIPYGQINFYEDVYLHKWIVTCDSHSYESSTYFICYLLLIFLKYVAAV